MTTTGPACGCGAPMLPGMAGFGTPPGIGGPPTF